MDFCFHILLTKVSSEDIKESKVIIIPYGNTTSISVLYMSSFWTSIFFKRKKKRRQILQVIIKSDNINTWSSDSVWGIFRWSRSSLKRFLNLRIAIFFCPQPSVWDVKMDVVSNLVLDNNSLLIFALWFLYNL